MLEAMLKHVVLAIPTCWAILIIKQLIKDFGKLTQAKRAKCGPNSDTD